MRIIDFHNHLGQSVDERVHQSAEEMLIEMDKFDVERAVVFPFFDKNRGIDYNEPNSRIRAVARDNERFIPFARLDPSNIEPALAEAARAFAGGGRGFKIHTQSEQFTFQQLHQVLENIQEYRLPIIIHFWDNLTTDWLDVFKRYPRIPFVIAHFGGMRHAPLAAKLARSLPNVYIETSCILFLFFAVVLPKIPVEKVLFGSDSPFSHPYLEIKKVALVTSEEQQQLIFWDNAARLLGL